MNARDLAVFLAGGVVFVALYIVVSVLVQWLLPLHTDIRPSRRIGS